MLKLSMAFVQIILLFESYIASLKPPLLFEKLLCEYVQNPIGIDIQSSKLS